MRAFLVLILIAATTRAGQLNADGLVDEVLKVILGKIHENMLRDGSNSMDLPPIALHGVDCRGDGWLGNLLTIRRIGNSTMKSQMGTFRLKTMLQFDNLHFGLNRCYKNDSMAWLLVSVGSNSINLEITLKCPGIEGCTVEINKLYFVKFESFAVRSNNQMIQSVIERRIARNPELIKRRINDAVFKSIKNEPCSWMSQ